MRCSDPCHVRPRLLQVRIGHRGASPIHRMTPYRHHRPALKGFLTILRSPSFYCAVSLHSDTRFTNTLLQLE